MSIIGIVIVFLLILFIFSGIVIGAFRRPMRSPITGILWMSSLILATTITNKLLYFEFYTNLTSNIQNDIAKLLVHLAAFLLVWILIGAIFTILFVIIAKPIKSFVENSNTLIIVDRVVGGIAGTVYGFMFASFMLILLWASLSFLPVDVATWITDDLNAGSSWIGWFDNVAEFFYYDTYMFFSSLLQSLVLAISV